MKLRNWGGVMGLTLLFALTSPLRAQDRDHDHDDHQPPGHAYGHDNHNHDHFDDHDRDAARNWYRDHHDYVRHDEGRYWHHQWEGNIHEGFVLTPEMRHAYRPVPVELYRQFPPPPRGYRYVVLGDHVVLIDNGYRIHDVMHFELNF